MATIELAAAGLPVNVVHPAHGMPHGLTGDLLRRCYLQYESTLRNLGRLEDSLPVSARGREAFPQSPSLAAFEAITMYAADRPDDAIATLLDVVTDHVNPRTSTATSLR